MKFNCLQLVVAECSYCSYRSSQTTHAGSARGSWFLRDFGDQSMLHVAWNWKAGKWFNIIEWSGSSRMISRTWRHVEAKRSTIAWCSTFWLKNIRNTILGFVMALLWHLDSTAEKNMDGSWFNGASHFTYSDISDISVSSETRETLEQSQQRISDITFLHSAHLSHHPAIYFFRPSISIGIFSLDIDVGFAGTLALQNHWSAKTILDA